MQKFIFVCALFGALSLAATVAESSPASAQQTQMVIEADEQRDEDGHVTARGYVDIKYGDVTLQADNVDYWAEEQRVIAEGNVVFQQGDQKIVGTRMEINLADGTGKFWNAHGVAGNDLYFYGDVIVRESKDVYIIERGAFTSCAQPTPRWHFTAGKARIHRDRNVRLHNAFFKVKSIPVFYAPIIYYPINEDERSTGFLLPSIGNSSLKGFLINQSFFWAINRSMDATINLDWFSQAGLGTGTEYRYVFSERSWGNFLSYFINDKLSEQREYSLNYSMNQELPGGFRSNARVDFFSSFEFQQRYQENYNAATRRSKRATGNISNSWSQYSFHILFERNDTSFSDSIQTRQILPTVTLKARPTAVLSTPLLFSFSTEASNFNRNNRGVEVEYQRFDLFPTISYPFKGWPFLTFRTSLSGRYTYYTATKDGSGINDEEKVDRRYYEAGFDMRGPTFARIFNTPGNFYADRYKHVVEPQIVWTYRSRVETFDEVPKFDSQDYVPGTNQFSLSLINRLFAKPEKEGAAQSAPVEFLTWVLSQRYFFDINASLYDRQFSTPYFTPDGTPSNYSPITSKVTFRPGTGFSASWNLEYDLNFSQMRMVSLTGTYLSRGRGSFRGMWSRRNLVQSGQVRNNLLGLANLKLTDRIGTNFDIAYDIVKKQMTQIRAAATYEVQCCGFMFEFARYQYGILRNENLFRFNVTLANIGSFGTFLGGGGRAQY